ncbi:hypothetical protein FRC06_003091 [Ceratobasidium sp. 370]|nr:hypothetical protein FRC06_003091 [Ceratobasidium sp. 370]
MNNHTIEIDDAPVYFVDDINSDEEQSDPELYSSSSMASGSADTLASSEVHGKCFFFSHIETRVQIFHAGCTEYFQEVNGRMFPSDVNVAINLPTDSAEIQRCINHHKVMKMLLRSNYWGPVQQVLAPTPGERERKHVLDMVTAEGSWVQEMAQQFPHVDFLSIDNVPLTTHVARSNIVFEVYDLYNGIAAPDASFDMVHMRQVTAHLRNPKDLIRDVHRILKPGGLLLFGDSELDAFDGLDPESPAGDKLPGLTTGFDIVRRGLAHQGVHVYLWRELPKLLSPQSDLWASRRGADQDKQVGFRNIRHKAHILPGNTWPEDAYSKELGRLAGPTWKGMWKSMEVPLQMFGMEPDLARQIVQGAVDDIDRTDVAVAIKFHTVYAFKI